MYINYQSHIALCVSYLKNFYIFIILNVMILVFSINLLFKCTFMFFMLIKKCETLREI